MEMVNGYVFLDLTKTNVYSKALKVLGTDKPVVIKDGSGSPYFVDSLTLDGTNVVITKGGKTITIANDNTITNEGDIQNHLWFIRFRANLSNNDDINEYDIFELYTNIEPNIDNDDFITLKNILVDNGAIKDDRALAVSGDKIIGLYVYNDSINYTDSSDNGSDIDISTSNIYEYVITQLF